MGLLMDESARRSYDVDRASFLLAYLYRPEADRPKAEEGEAATIATSRVAEAEVAAQVARRAILPEPERLEPDT